MALQLFRAASSIAAHLEEAQVAKSRQDVAAKQAIGLREARESLHWMRLFAADGRFVNELQPLLTEGGEIVAMLTTSVRKLREGRE